MRKRLQLDLFLDGLTAEEIAFLRQLRAKAVDVGGEKSKASFHNCGHENGESCSGKVEL